MPGIVRKLLIFAAADGLILQPLEHRNQRPVAPIQIDYKSHSISPVLKEIKSEKDAPAQALTALGIIGLLNISSTSYLISISRRQLVAQFWGKPIYVVTDIALIPISSQQEAQTAISRAAERAKRHAYESDLADDDGADSGDNATISSEGAEVYQDRTAVIDARNAQELSLAGSNRSKEPGIAEEVIARRGAYSTFAQRWFSQRGWGFDKRRIQGTSSAPTSTVSSPNLDSTEFSPEPRQIDVASERSSSLPRDVNSNDKNAAVSDSVALKLLPKLLHTTRLLLTSKTFFFSYDNDITRRMQAVRRVSTDLPLHKQADPQYFWNAHLSQPFAERGYHEFVLPVMQGFVGQTEFTLTPSPGGDPLTSSTPPGYLSMSTSPPATIESRAFLLTLISRRSVRRAGLRYLRRGIDEDGNVANNVETEQILSTPDWTIESGVHSFVQTRGSIPIFFSQTPYTFKPPPVLHASSEDNKRALAKHFRQLSNSYGDVHAVSLIDAHGPEADIGRAYESYISSVQNSGTVGTKAVDFTWFEFHSVCRGMKFENVSLLVEKLAPFLATHSWTLLSAPQSPQLQTGIVRTNCMDCLDRTNVVQSAIALHMLSLQLGSTPPSDFPAFNAVWADNGDAISRAYAGTAALKGDYTRTRRRNLRGALTDLTLTLERYYRNLFDDFFAQAAIDYLLGEARESVFADFAINMTTADPAIDLRRARQQAVSAAAGVVLGSHGDDIDTEDLLHGWTLLSPAANTLTRPLAELVLLLTGTALYAVHVDWDRGGDKILGYERVPLAALTGLRRGTYITETFAPAQTDPETNQGFVVRFRAGGERRVNTRSLETDQNAVAGTEDVADGENRILAFKAVRSRSAFVKDEIGAVQESERKLVEDICSEIVRAVEADRRTRNGGSNEGGGLQVEEQDIMSLDDATHNTSYIEQIGYTLKKLVWG